MREDIHVLTYHGNYTFQDVMEMTYQERQWFIKRLLRQFKMESKWQRK